MMSLLVWLPWGGGGGGGGPWEVGWGLLTRGSAY